MNSLARTDLFTSLGQAVTLTRTREGRRALASMITKLDSQQDPRPRTRHRAKPDPAPRGDDAGKRADDAITNLSAYALKLDFEYHRLHDRLVELLEDDAAAAEELRTALRERDELGAGRDAFRQSLAALQDLTRREAQPSRSDQL